MIPRECGCPVWVIRCAHFDGDGLILARSHGCHGNAGAYSVSFLCDRVMCEGCGEPGVPLSRAYYYGYDLDAADDAFDKAVARLLTEASS